MANHVNRIIFQNLQADLSRYTEQLSNSISSIDIKKLVNEDRENIVNFTKLANKVLMNMFDASSTWNCSLQNNYLNDNISSSNSNSLNSLNSSSSSSSLNYNDSNLKQKKQQQQQNYEIEGNIIIIDGPIISNNKRGRRKK